MKIMLDTGAYPPSRAYSTDAGMDIRTPIAFTVPAHESITIDTGGHIQLPPNTAGMLKNKSGLNVKYSITSEGVIDYGYTGAISAKLYNHGNEPVSFKPGDKITQLVIVPVVIPDKMEYVNVLEDAERGNNGFGSTGR